MATFQAFDVGGSGPDFARSQSVGALVFTEAAQPRWLMRARDSVNGMVYRWVMAFPADAGQGYPGPNTPLEINAEGPY